VDGLPENARLNSLVLPAGSVAVAVTDCPGERVTLKSGVKDTFPAPSVVISTNPM
jgi:hypothetical protein